MSPTTCRKHAISWPSSTASRLPLFLVFMRSLECISSLAECLYGLSGSCNISTLLRVCRGRCLVSSRCSSTTLRQDPEMWGLWWCRPGPARRQVLPLRQLPWQRLPRIVLVLLVGGPRGCGLLILSGIACILKPARLVAEDHCTYRCPRRRLMQGQCCRISCKSNRLLDVAQCLQPIPCTDVEAVLFSSKNEKTCVVQLDAAEIL